MRFVVSPIDQIHAGRQFVRHRQRLVSDWPATGTPALQCDHQQACQIGNANAPNCASQRRIFAEDASRDFSIRKSDEITIDHGTSSPLKRLLAFGFLRAFSLNIRLSTLELSSGVLISPCA